jgi:hypothetical protein
LADFDRARSKGSKKLTFEALAGRAGKSFVRQLRKPGRAVRERENTNPKEKYELHKTNH